MRKFASSKEWRVESIQRGSYTNQRARAQAKHNKTSSPARAATTIASPDRDESVDRWCFLVVCAALVCVKVSFPSVFPCGAVVAGLEGTEAGLPALSVGVEVVVLAAGGAVVAFTLSEAGTGNFGAELVWVGALVDLLVGLIVFVGVCLVADGKNELGSSAANAPDEWQNMDAAKAMLSAAMRRGLIDRWWQITPPC